MMLMQIKLTNKTDKRFFWCIKERENSHIPLYQLTLSDKKHLNAHPAFIIAVTENIPVFSISKCHFLLFHHHFNMLNLIPKFPCPFKIQLLACFIHFLFSILLNFLKSALQERSYVLYNLSILLCGRRLFTACQTLTHMVI